MTGYCGKGKTQEKKCEKARNETLKKYKGKLPLKLLKTPMESCLYCSSFMESGDY